MTRVMLSTLLTVYRCLSRVDESTTADDGIFYELTRRRNRRLIPWPAEFSEPWFVHKTNHLYGRWITVSGGDAEYIRSRLRVLRLFRIGVPFVQQPPSRVLLLKRSSYFVREKVTS